MSKICIISDSHDRLSSLKFLFETLNKNNVSTIFHAGDAVFPPFFNDFFKYEFTIHFVRGNNDGEYEFLKATLQKNNSYFYPEYMDIKMENKRIFMIHKDDLVIPLALSGLYDIIIYGHTHRLDIKKENNTLLINPGALSGYLTDFRSFVILDLNTLSYDIYKF